MRKRFLPTLLFLLFIAIPTFAQLRVTLNVSPRPDPYLSNWAQRKETAIVTIVNSGTTAVRAKFDCKINKDGSLIVNTKPDKMKILEIPTGVSQYYGEDLVPLEAAKIKEGADKTAIQTGMLPAGSYEFCCALLDPQDKQLTAPVCKSFTLQSYQAPVLLQPEDKSILAQNKRPMFRWTGISPKPQFPIKYRLQVFEVLPGQTPINAFRANRPILDRTDIMATQYQWPADVEMPSPKLQHIWTVRALDDKDNSIGEPYGYATPFVIEPCCLKYGDVCCPPDMVTDNGGGVNAKVASNCNIFSNPNSSINGAGTPVINGGTGTWSSSFDNNQVTTFNLNPNFNSPNSVGALGVDVYININGVQLNATQIGQIGTTTSNVYPYKLAGSFTSGTGGISYVVYAGNISIKNSAFQTGVNTVTIQYGSYGSTAYTGTICYSATWNITKPAPPPGSGGATTQSADIMLVRECNIVMTTKPTVLPNGSVDPHYPYYTLHGYKYKMSGSATNVMIKVTDNTGNSHPWTFVDGGYIQGNPSTGDLGLASPVTFTIIGLDGVTTCSSTSCKIQNSPYQASGGYHFKDIVPGSFSMNCLKQMPTLEAHLGGVANPDIKNIPPCPEIPWDKAMCSIQWPFANPATGNSTTINPNPLYSLELSGTNSSGNLNIIPNPINSACWLGIKISPQPSIPVDVGTNIEILQNGVNGIYMMAANISDPPWPPKDPFSQDDPYNHLVGDQASWRYIPYSSLFFFGPTTTLTINIRCADNNTILKTFTVNLSN